MAFQTVIVEGNLGKDPEMRYTPQGTAITSFSVAVNEGKHTEWFNVVAFNKTAEVANQYLNKGQEVLIQGRLNTRSWDGDKGKQYRTELVADKVNFIGKKRDEEAADEDTDI